MQQQRPPLWLRWRQLPPRPHLLRALRLLLRLRLACLRA
jgi:hypothetical protein